MAQIANRDTERDETNRAADTAKEATDRTVSLTKETTNRATDAAKAATDRAGDASRRVIEGASRAVGTAARADNDLARLWIEVTQEQLQHNAETFQRLAAVRDWRQAIDIQSAYIQDSLSRMADALSRHMDLAGSFTSRLIETGRSQTPQVH
jgi:hypothetical protein